LVRKQVPLKELVLRLNISLWGQFLKEKRPFKKVTPKVGANIGAITRILLRIEMKNYSHHYDNGNVLNQTSTDIGPFITNLSDKVSISVLLIETKSFGVIWSFGEMLWGYIWVPGRFSKLHNSYIREEDYKSNKQIMDKLLVQMSLLVSY
jgi:hypothetical protein